MNNKKYGKDVPGFSKYEASSFGNIRNKKTQKLIKAYENKYYYSIKLYNDQNKLCTERRAKIICETFYPETDDYRTKKYTVEHIISEEKNDHINNLRWCALSEYNKEQDSNKEAVIFINQQEDTYYQKNGPSHWDGYHDIEEEMEDYFHTQMMKD